MKTYYVSSLFISFFSLYLLLLRFFPVYLRCTEQNDPTLSFLLSVRLYNGVSSSSVSLFSF